MRRSNLTIELFAHPCIDRYLCAISLLEKKWREKKKEKKKNNRKIVYLRFVYLRISKETTGRRIRKCTLKWKYTFSGGGGGVFSFSRPKTSTMVTFLKIRRQQWDRHLVSKRAQCSFVNVSTILVRSSFKGARNSKTIHTSSSVENLVKRRGCQFLPPPLPSFFSCTTRVTTTRETGPR